MFGFWNVREFVLHRDGHKCQNPNCIHKDKKEQILKVHHIRYRSEGGSDRPENLITLCSKCHTPANHKKGKFLYDWCVNGKKVRGFKDATFMSMIRWYLVNELKSYTPECMYGNGRCGVRPPTGSTLRPVRRSCPVWHRKCSVLCLRAGWNGRN